MVRYDPYNNDYVKADAFTGLLLCLSLRRKLFTMKRGERRREKMKHLCPVCGQYEFTRRSANPLDGCYLGCKVCGWIDDAVLELEPDFDGGELGISLNQARAEWAAKHK